MPALARLSFRTVLVSLLAVFAGCEDADEGLMPPPFNGEPARLFYPVGLALAPGGDSLFVANSNFDRAFAEGTLVQLDLQAFDAIDPQTGRGELRVVEGGVGLLDSFAGQALVSSTGDRVFVATRESETLSAAPIVNGVLSCPPDASRAGLPNCSNGAVRLEAQDMADPFSLAPLTLQTETGAVPAVAVAHLSPLADDDGIGRNARIAILPESTIGTESPFTSGAFTVDIGAFASSSVAYSPDLGELFVGGCFKLVASGTSTVECVRDFDDPVSQRNPLRTLLPDAGAQASVTTTNLGAVLGGGSTTGLALSSDGARLFVTTTRPNALIVFDTPPPATSSEPVARLVLPLAHTPSQMLVLPRPDGDLIVLTATETDALLIVDPALGQVVAQVQPIGDAPFGLAARRDTDRFRVFVGLFEDCAVAAIDVPDATPWAPSIVGTVGACPL